MSDHTIADILDISRTVYMEAAGEPYVGKLAVAWVIKNRRNESDGSYQDVIFKSKQFSAWNTDSPTRMNLDDFISAAWIDSVKAASSAYFNIETDPTASATMYHATS